MKLIICAIRDSAVNAFLRPFFAQAVGAAVRSFGDECARGGDSAICAHPEDYELYELGTFDEETGKFGILDSARSVARGKDFRKEVHHEAAPR